MSTSPSSLPLAGLQVVEATSFVAGPLSGLTLAQMGADVIRMDHVGGAADAGRWPITSQNQSLFWANLNRGVRSVAVNFSSDAGRELATELICRPGPNNGLFVDNTIGRDFLSFEQLSKKRADLVHVHIQGNPDGTAAMDYAVNPRFGVPMLTRPVDSDRPVNHVLPAWDIATGLLAVGGLLAGVHKRHQTGEGSRIDVALSDVAAANVANFGWLAEAAERGGDRPRLGNHMYGAFGVDFVCADDRRVIAVAITRQQWRDLMKITGTDEVFASLAEAHKTNFDIEGERFENRALIEAVLAPWFAARTSSEVLEAASGTRVMIGDFRTPFEVVESFRAGQESKVLTEIEQPRIGQMLTSRSPLRWDDVYGEAEASPEFGQDTEWALTELLGLTDADLGRLIESGTIRDR